MTCLSPWATHDAYIEVDTGAVICQVNRSDPR